MAKVEPGAGKGASIDIAGGSKMQPLYRERKLKCYLVTEGDLSHLSLANWLVTGLAAIGSFLLSQAMQISLSASFSPEMTPAAKVLTGYAGPLMYCLAAVAFVGAVAAHFWRSSHIAIIKRESGE